MHECVDAYYDFFLTFTLYVHKNADTCYVWFFLTLIMMCDNDVMFISSMHGEW